jgi:hypothetical protein
VPACSRGHEKEWIYIIESLPNPSFDKVNCYLILFSLSFCSLLLYEFARFSWLSIGLFTFKIKREITLGFRYNLSEKGSQTLPVILQEEKHAV